MLESSSFTGVTAKVIFFQNMSLILLVPCFLGRCEKIYFYF
jgi:hypothetical protein